MIPTVLLFDLFEVPLEEETSRDHPTTCTLAHAFSKEPPERDQPRTNPTPGHFPEVQEDLLSGLDYLQAVLSFKDA